MRVSWVLYVKPGPGFMLALTGTRSGLYDSGMSAYGQGRKGSEYWWVYFVGLVLMGIVRTAFRDGADHRPSLPSGPPAKEVRLAFRGPAAAPSSGFAYLPVETGAYDDGRLPLDFHADLGTPKKSGSVRTAKGGTFLIEGAGANMWFGEDEGHFVWKALKGDFIVSARVAFDGPGVEDHRKIGWMARSTLHGASAQASAVVHGDGLVSLQFRRQPATDTEEIRLPLSGADQIQLERRGSTYIMSAARFGEPYVHETIEGVDLGAEALVGLFVCSHNPEVVEKARFTNVRVTLPPPADLVPYQDYIGGAIELLDVDTGTRRTVYAPRLPIQAPNWSENGRFLFYNIEGRIERLILGSGRTAAVDTGAVASNNNDHVPSWDGKWLGISHDGGGGSVISVVPAKGGTPRQVTAKAPSYLHGWSADDRMLVFTAERDGNFDIYKIPVEGGPEIRLTDAPGLDDGPEYTPDGKLIYFNSARTGAMRIWRMRPDGSGQEPVTDGMFHNWFPHVSPDGKRIVFLSFEKDVAADDHPFYKQVYIRMMPLDGSAPPKVVAYVFGGQGTINVPSWAPDARRIAFVSNSR
jgi:TolB protein